jgi:uncharacterized protein (TIGR02217 family)
MFVEISFPSCPSFGFTSEPMYSVTAIETAGGHEVRNRNHSRPRHRYTASVSRVEAEVAELLEFWHALGGSAYGFRFKDYADYKSCRINETISATDQPLVQVPDSPEFYQLTKRYTAGPRSQDREIYKPVQGTILIADGGVQLTEGVNYSIDYTRGTVDFLTATSGALTWGGEFEVPVRFDSPFPIELINLRVQSVPFNLKELVGEDSY